MVMAIIPAGPDGKEPEELDAYFELLVDELLKELHVFRDYAGAPVTVKIKLLRFVLDFPGMAKVFHQNQQNAYYCCQKCRLKGNKYFMKGYYFSVNARKIRVKRI